MILQQHATVIPLGSDTRGGGGALNPPYDWILTVAHMPMCYVFGDSTNHQ